MRAAGKRIFVSALIWFLPFPFFSQNLAGGDGGLVFVRDAPGENPAPAPRPENEAVPPLLRGIWQGDDRLLMFSDESEFALVLRVFYQWYNDRAAEPPSFSELRARDRNDTTKSPAEDIQIQYITVVENPSRTAGVYELSVRYPGERERTLIPVCVIDGKIYLDFLIKDSALVTDFRSRGGISSDSDGFYRAASSCDGITISPPVFRKEVVSYLVSDSGKDVYRIRYWLSEMEYSYEKATFSDGDKVFAVDKYLRIGSDVYQCTTGKSTKIRNIQKSSRFGKGAAYDSDGGIVGLGEPYLVKVPEGDDRTALETSSLFLDSVIEGNRRRQPPPKPLFPPTFPRYRWKEIGELELYNPSTWNKRNLDIHK